MIEIPTTRGKTIFVDEDDEELVSGFKWYVSGTTGNRLYAHARWPDTFYGASRCIMHRLILGAPKGLHVHHKNNNGLDNRKENLVLMTPGQHSKEHAPGQIGIYFDKKSKRFRAQLRVDGETVNLGLHADRATALRAVALAKQLLPGLSRSAMKATAENIKQVAQART